VQRLELTWCAEPSGWPVGPSDPDVIWADDHVCVRATGGGGVDQTVTPETVVVVLGRLHDGPTSQADAAAHVANRYRRLGADLVAGLRGEYAGIVYDRRTHEAILFRDLVGGRSMYYGRTGADLVAGTMLRPMLDHAGIDAVPDDDWVAEYLGWGIAPADATPYRGIRRLLGGHVATTARDGWRVEPHDEWQLHREPASPAEDLAEFRRRFDTAVSRRLSSPGNAAVFLSGGLDSTSLLATARAVRPDARLSAISIPFAAPEGDERAMQRRIAELTGTPQVWVDLEGYGPLGGDPTRVLERFGAPPGPTNWFIGDALANSARANGAAVVMDGEDGDSLLNGSAHFFSDLLVRGRLIRWYAEARGMRTINASWQSIVAASVRPLTPAALRTVLRPERRPGHLGKDLAARRRPTPARWQPGFAFRSDETALLDDDVRTKLTYQTCDWFPERDLALARPFMDRDLIEFCVQLPWDRKVSGGTYKLMLRRAMSGRLPEDLLARRTKANLSSAFATATARWDRRWIVQGLELARDDRSGWFDADGVATLQRSLTDGPADVWHARVAMAAWWRQWLTDRCQPGR
jgi:asparagine synthase (glutamine-hydrolysing)